MMDKKIIGYADQMSVAPGERIRFMVSCEPGVSSYRADIVRLLSGDTQPDGPGYRDEAVPSPASGEYPGRYQAVHAGAFGVVPHHRVFENLSSLSLQVTIYPTLPDARRACVLSKTDPDRGTGFALWCDPHQGMVFAIGDDAGGVREVSVGRPLIAREWYLVQATCDAGSGEVRVSQRLLESYAHDTSGGSARTRFEGDVSLGCDAPLLIAAHSRERDRRGRPVPELIFNGRIERPLVASRPLSEVEFETLRHGPLPAALRPALCAAFDFSREIHSDTIVDISPNRLHGELVNLPIRAVRGSNWTGEEMNYHHAPEQYAAIHFLEDALYDCEWETDFELEVPEDARSGFYAAKLTNGDQEDHIPFFVRPPRGSTTAPLLLIAPTASYLAYANWRSGMENEHGELDYNHITEIFPEDRYLNMHPELGNSMYDHHADGTGVCYSSRLRPILNFRPKHGSLWQLSADMHLVDWLESNAIAYDVLTDEDLHAEGVECLRRYRCVMTCTHPEYYSTPMWNGLYAYTQGGGRLMYLGGNGFYWRVAFRDDKPGAMEMRRAEDGSRSWIPEPGEYYMSFNGEYGGMWWRCGRTPQYLVGNGFVAQGFDFSSYYRRNPDSFDPRGAFVFEGVEADELIGDFGLIGGGAAGIELDFFNRGYGTPPHALNLASSEKHTDSYLHVNEDVGHMYLPIGGQDDPAVRADIVFFETPNGGAVFSTGSIGWCSALFHQGYDNNVSRITRNVLDRFLDATSFDTVD